MMDTAKLKKTLKRRTGKIPNLQRCYQYLKGRGLSQFYETITTKDGKAKRRYSFKAEHVDALVEYIRQGKSNELDGDFPEQKNPTQEDIIAMCEKFRQKNPRELVGYHYEPYEPPTVNLGARRKAGRESRATHEQF